MSDQTVTTQEMIALVHGRLSAQEASRIQALVYTNIDLRREFEELRAVARYLDEMMLMPVDPMRSVADEIIEELAEATPSRTLYRLAAFMTMCGALVLGLFLWNDITPPGGGYGGDGCGQGNVCFYDIRNVSAAQILRQLEPLLLMLERLSSGIALISFGVAAVKRSRRANTVGVIFLIVSFVCMLLQVAIFLI